MDAPGPPGAASRGAADPLTRSRRRRVTATVAAVVLAVAGTMAVAAALASQKHAPRPSPSAGGTTAPTAGLPSTPTTEAPPAAPLVLPPSEPLAIDIPAIGVHSKLQYLGVAQDGTLEVPAPGPLYNEAAWYKYSPTPGSLGPAIISGHVDSVRDGPSVFFRLGDLRPGDNVMVARADGLVAVFKVDGVRVYPKDQFPTQLVYGNTDHAALRLLTCGGPFDRASGHYVDNVIVFASLVGPPQASTGR
jgi:sortase (surface protein transpeptidase)